MKKRSRFRRRTAAKEDMNLQITSMADIFTIILVFLLKSFSTGVTSITPSGGVALPLAKAEAEVAEVLKLEIAPQSIMLDDKPVTVLHDYALEPADAERDGTPRSLNLALAKIRNRFSGGTVAANGRDDASAHLMILADKKAPYGLIKSVSAAAGNNGFLEFKLAVIREE